MCLHPPTDDVAENEHPASQPLSLPEDVQKHLNGDPQDPDTSASRTTSALKTVKLPSFQELISPQPTVAIADAARRAIAMSLPSKPLNSLNNLAKAAEQTEKSSSTGFTPINALPASKEQSEPKPRRRKDNKRPALHLEQPSLACNGESSRSAVIPIHQPSPVISGDKPSSPKQVTSRGEASSPTDLHHGGAISPRTKRMREVKIGGVPRRECLGPIPPNAWPEEEWNSKEVQEYEKAMDLEGLEHVQLYEAMSPETRVKCMDMLSDEINMNACICQSAWRLQKSTCYALPPAPPPGAEMPKNDENIFKSHPFRSAVSHFFGRNMKETKHLNLFVLGRTCYQRSKYQEAQYRSFVYRLVELALAVNDRDFPGLTYKIALVQQDREWFDAWSKRPDGQDTDRPRPGGPTARLMQYTKATYIDQQRPQTKLQCFKMIDDIQKKINGPEKDTYFWDDKLKEIIATGQKEETRTGTKPKKRTVKEIQKKFIKQDITSEAMNTMTEKEMSSEEASKFLEVYFKFLIIPEKPEAHKRSDFERRSTKLNDNLYAAIKNAHEEKKKTLEKDKSDNEARKAIKAESSQPAPETRKHKRTVGPEAETEDAEGPVMPKRRRIADLEVDENMSEASSSIVPKRRQTLKLKTRRSTPARTRRQTSRKASLEPGEIEGDAIEE